MKTRESICSSCRKVKTEGNFYKIPYSNIDKRLPVCKDCCAEKILKYSLIVGDDGAVWTLLAEMGIPFLIEVYRSAVSLVKSSQRTKSPYDITSAYLKKIGETGVVYQGFFESDTMLTDLKPKKYERKADNVQDLEAMRKKWGKFSDSDEAYVFLEDTFNNYTSELLNIDEDENLKNRYIDLCIAEWFKRKAQESGDMAEISKAQDVVSKQLKLLKIDDFQVKTKDEREKFIDRLCWMIEETEPAEEEDLEKYRDIAGFELSFSQIMRSMQNLICHSKEYPDVPRSEQ